MQRRYSTKTPLPILSSKHTLDKAWASQGIGVASACNTSARDRISSPSYPTKQVHTTNPSNTTQKLQIKQPQPSQLPLINNPTPSNLLKPPRSLSNLDGQSMSPINNPPIRTSNQSPTSSLRTTAYESIPAVAVSINLNHSLPSIGRTRPNVFFYLPKTCSSR